MTRTYFELIQFPSFEDRFRYLKLSGLKIGETTFGHARWVNQEFYRTQAWRSARNQAIIRDEGRDLAHPDYPIGGGIRVHHINPINEQDILENRPCLYDLNNLVCVSLLTHNAIHYGDESLLPKAPVVRYPGDTVPWRQNEWQS